MSNVRKGKTTGTEENSGSKVGTVAPKGGSKKRMTYIFKSKYAEDRVRLKPPEYRYNERGEKTVTPAVYAEFHWNTWRTHDDHLAQMLRDKIEARTERDPLYIVETTTL